MKKKFLLFALGCIMLLALLSCGKEPPAAPDHTEALGEAIEPYQITYVSNGDGTCYVSGVTVDPSHTLPFVLSIPPTSPAGDQVTAIQCEPFGYPVPKVLTEEEYKALIGDLKSKNGLDPNVWHESDLLIPVYERRDVEEFLCGEPNPETKEKTYVYVYRYRYVDGCIAVTVNEKEVFTLLQKYTGYAPADLEKSDQRVRELIRSMGSSKEEEMLAALPQVPQNCGTYIIEIRLPDTVKEISRDFYASCPLLERVDLPDSLTAVSYGMFRELEHLRTVSIPEGVTLIDASAFYNCVSIERLHIPNGVSTIGRDAFGWCLSLRELTLPAGLVDLHPDAFHGLRGTAIYFGGSQQEWQAFELPQKSSVTYYTAYSYSESQPTPPGRYWRYVDGVPTAWW